MKLSQPRQWAKDNPERTKEIQNKYDAKRRSPERLNYKINKELQRKYGITPEDYENMMEYQDHSCKICNVFHEDAATTRGRRLVVDHCHTTGKVRGLLCVKCNAGIGMFNDKIDNLISAISYLKESL